MLLDMVLEFQCRLEDFSATSKYMFAIELQAFLQLVLVTILPCRWFSHAAILNYIEDSKGLVQASGMCVIRLAHALIASMCSQG